MHKKYQVADLWLIEYIFGFIFLIAASVNAIVYASYNGNGGFIGLIINSLVSGGLLSVLMLTMASIDHKRSKANENITLNSNIYFKEKTDVFHNALSKLNRACFLFLISLCLISVSVVQLAFGFGRYYTVAIISNYVGFNTALVTFIVFRLTNLIIEYHWEKDYLWIIQYETIKKKK